MMGGWKLTKKLKDFGTRSKSPAPKEHTEKKGDSSSIISSAASSSKLSSPSTENVSRRDTVTPASNSHNITTNATNANANAAGTSTHSIRPVSSHSSNMTATSEANPRSTTSPGPRDPPQSEHINPFKPGMLTIKVYTGAHFHIPFDINYDRNVLTRLINTGSDPSEDALVNRLKGLTVSEDKLGSKDSSSVIPAAVTIPPSIMKHSLIYFTMEFDKTIVSIDPDSGSMSAPVFNKISQFDVTKVKNELKLQVFMRIPAALLENPVNGQGQEILISSKTIPLSLDNISNPIRIKNHAPIVLDNEHPDFPQQSNGEIVMSIDFKPNENKHLSIDDFDLLKVIGKGSFGKVMQVRKRDSNKIYALKAIRKSHIVSRSEVTHTLAERTVLARVDNPFIVPLKFSFQSPEKLYLVLSFINGGELFYHLQKEGRFELSRARFYTCELLSALECLHSYDVIYRDLKPENILLDYKGHIALCDFGLCKLNMKNQDKTTTFCGTPEYLAPELLLGHGYTKSVDWWTLGILLYEMLTGLPPYYDEDVPTMYKKILTNPLKFPENFDRDAKDLLIGLLSRDPKNRLGTRGAHEIKEHAFFKMIDWNKLNNKGYLPPFKPPVKDSSDTSNFDKEFTSEQPVDSVVNEYLSDSVQKQFGGWTYVGTEHLGDSVNRN